MALETGSAAAGFGAFPLGRTPSGAHTGTLAGTGAQNGFSRYMESSLESVRVSLERSAVPIDSEEEKRLYDQCLELETFLVKNLLNGMRKNVMKSSLVDTGYAGEIYEDMLWDEYARDYTRGGGFGLAEAAYLELTGRRGKVNLLG